MSDRVRTVAQANPRAMLPCPVCAAAVRGANLGEHLDRKHPGASAPEPPFHDARRLSAARLELTADGWEVRGRMGVGGRRVVPARAESGGLSKSGSTSLMSSYTDDDPSLAESVTRRVGLWLGVTGEGGRITIGCPASTGLRSHWDGLGQGEKNRKLDLLVDPAAFVALQYALVRAGVLRPRS